MRGDDHLVRVQLRDGVHRGLEGVLVAHLADQLDALGGEELLRQVDPHLGGVADGLVVDDRPVAGAVLRHDERKLRVAACVSRENRLDQLGAADRLVGDDEDFRHLLEPHSLVGAVATVPAGFASAGDLNTPCTAPGTPYS